MKQTNDVKIMSNNKLFIINSDNFFYTNAITAATQRPFISLHGSNKTESK